MAMRRGRLVMIGVLLLLLVAGVCLSALGSVTPGNRYHQHLEQPSEEALGDCTVCGGKGSLCTHLPIVCIETGGQKIPGKAVENKHDGLVYYETGDNGQTEIAVSCSTVDQQGAWHHPGDTPSFTGQALMRIRGNSSRFFSKSSYRLVLTAQGNPELEEKHALLGMAPGSEWVLHGPFLDKTLIRNYLCLNVAGEVMGYAPNVRFCELMLDGEYQGVYMLIESIKVQPGRVDLTRYRDGDAVMSYMVRIQSPTDPEKAVDHFTFYSYRLEQDRQMELVYPGRANQSSHVKSYVATDIDAVEKLLYSPQMVQGTADWQKVINASSFVDYYILQEFFGINDTFSNSTYFYRDVRGKLSAGPVWDFNNALDNFFDPLPGEGFLLSQRGWFGQLMQDEQFVEAVIQRYRQLRRGVLSESSLVNYVNSAENWLGSAADRNFEVWGWSFDPEQLSTHERRRPEVSGGQELADVNPASREEAVQWMTDYMTERGRWMDEHIDSLRQYCHESRSAVQAAG